MGSDALGICRMDGKPPMQTRLQARMKDSEIQSFESLKCCPQEVEEHQWGGRVVEWGGVPASPGKGSSLLEYWH